MTRKDYVLIAAALKQAHLNAIENGVNTQPLQDVAGLLCARLAQDNPRFDRARFLAAAGVQS